MMSVVNWVSWKGPFLLLPAKALQFWEGCDPPSGGRVVSAHFRWDPDRPATDYDRACDVNDFVGLIRVAREDCLVLGDEIPMVTLLQVKGNLVLFIPITWENDDSYRLQSSIIATVVSVWSEFVATGIAFHHVGGPIVLQAAAFAGRDEIEVPRMSTALEQGTYDVETVERVREPWFRAHRLRPRLSNRPESPSISNLRTILKSASSSRMDPRRTVHPPGEDGGGASRRRLIRAL